MPPEEDLAASLRQKHLPRARIARTELFEDDETQQRFNFHGCRHTHLTLRAARGDNATELMGSVLQADFLTTMQYIDQAVLHAMRRQKDSIFALLPADLIEGARGGASPARTRAQLRAAKAIDRDPNRAGGGDPETPTGSALNPTWFNLRPQRELKPKKRHFLSWRCRSSFVGRFRESHGFLA